MTNTLPDSSPVTRARIVAVLMLTTIVCGIIAELFIGDRLIVAGNAAATARNIMANAPLFRTGFAIYMVEMICQVAMVALYYDLLKPVNRSVARIALVLGLIGCGIKMFSRLFYYLPLIILGSGEALAAFDQAQLEALSLVLLRVNANGPAIALILFGVESVLQGWLVFRSTFLPRFLGVLSMVGGLGWITFLSPPLGMSFFMIIAPLALVGSIASIGWMLVRGVDEARWRERQAMAAASIWR